MRTSFTLALFPAVFFVNAQVNNGGFEDLSVDGLAQYWVGDLHIVQITIDTNGVSHTDSVVYDGGTDYALSADARTGANAMELRNGYNFTSDAPIVGRLHANSDSVSYGGFPIISVPVTQRPTSVEFWAKYAPLGNDSAFASITVLDEAQNTIGYGELSIGGDVPAYAPFQIPVTYSTEDVAAFVQLTFATAAPWGTATLGTRLLIDDVSVTSAPNGLVEVGAEGKALELFPVPADGYCTIRAGRNNTVLAVNLLGIDGSTFPSPVVQAGGFDTSALPAGGYVLSVRTAEGNLRSRLLVVH